MKTLKYAIFSVNLRRHLTFSLHIQPLRRGEKFGIPTSTGIL